MDNKLSELGKPVGFIEQSGMDYLRSGADADIWPDDGRGDDIPLYSQEYVSAMLEELEAKDEALRELAFRVSAGGYNAGSVDAEVFKQKIIDGIDSISGVLIKRIDELESIRAAASQVFKEIGNELGCNPDNESIMMAIDELKKRLATPVPTGKFAGWGLYHAGRDDFGSWLKRHPEDDSGDAITKHGYVNVKLFTAPPAPAVIDEVLEAMAEVIRISDRDHDAWNKAKAAITAFRAAMQGGRS